MKNPFRILSAMLSLCAACALGQTQQDALFRAIDDGELPEFSRLVDAGIHVLAKNKLDETPLYVAAEKGNLEMVRLLLARGADAKARTPNGETPLYWAAMTGTFMAVKALADAGADLNVQEERLGNTALHAAVAHDDIALIHYLLSKNVRIDIRNNEGLTALDIAEARGRGSVTLFER